MEYLIRSILLLGFLAGLIFCMDLLESENSGNIEYFDYDRDTRYGVIATPNVIWDEAVILCKAKDARLAVMDTSDKARFAGRILADLNLPTEDIWVGGIKRGNAFYWINNSPVNASVMKGVLKPRNFPVWPEDPQLNASNGRCLAIGRQGHENPLFVNIRCKLQRAFMCEFNKTGTCVVPKGPHITDNHIHYFLYHGAVTWGEAAFECRKMGLMLAILDDTHIIRLMGSRMQRTRPAVERAWIGGHFTRSNWVWLGTGQMIDKKTYTTEMSVTDPDSPDTSEDDLDDEDTSTPPPEDDNNDDDDEIMGGLTGDDEPDYEDKKESTEPSYPPWHRIPPLHEGCLVLDRHTCNYPTFVEEICSRERSYICQTDVTSDADPDIVDINPRFALSKVKKSWDDAKKSCAEYYKTGTLVTLDESKGHEFLTEIMHAMINHLWKDMRSLWIGGRRKFDKNKREMRWKWVGIDEDIANQSQGEREMNVNFTMYPPWAPKVPDELDFDCLSLDRENHLQMFMYGLQCNLEQYYGCTHELEEKPLKRTYRMGLRQPAPGKVRAKQQSNGRRSMEAGTTTGMTVESVLPEITNALGHSGVLSTTPDIIGNNTDTG